MGFFSKIFKGIKKVVKGIGKVVKKVVKSKAFKVIAAVALAVVAPQLIPTVIKGISSAGAWAAKTIATGAKAAWTAAKTIGTGLKTFGSKVFSSVTDTIAKGVEFMKTKVGFGTPSTLTGSSAAATEANLANFFGQEAVGSNVAKMTLKDKAYKTFGTAAVDTFSKLTKPVTDIVKDPVKELVVDPITGMAKDVTGEKILDTIAGERREKSLLGSPVYTTKTGDFDSSGGFAPLMSLSIDTQSPYISYNQGQQLFGMKGQA
jgi:hypothetical protein|tara:strand:- start:9820 stop:10602 length:783 start_codon:yes stop_codon:yes gene_type:complete